MWNLRAGHARGADVAGAPATWAVETTLFRALAVLRAVVLVNTIVVNVAVKWDGMARPGMAAAALVVMTLWTGFAAWAYDHPRRRGVPLLLADLVLSVGLVLLTPAVRGDDQANLTTLPSFWVMAVVLAWGIRWGWPGGLVAATAVSASDVAIRAEVSQTNLGNIFLLMIGGPLIGYATGLLKEMAAARDRAEREAAAAAERARLARAVHDGVLQVLSLVKRRGLEIGGEAAELGRLAGEQEVVLRSLVQAVATPGPDAATADLAARLSALQSPRVTVSVPGGPVELPASVAGEVESVVRACLDNVDRHVGSDARAWVLVEDMGSSVLVTVRDEGPGIPDGRLEQAAAEGRLGVRESICGRMKDLGGSASLVTGPRQGTEWELSVPRWPADRLTTPR